ncbi:hypothetical protein ACHAXR_002870 [Thalassiosira sp. AJA248-18]
MSRAFTPPDTLSPDDIRTVADVRRAVWINGMFGLGAGAVTGMVGHLVLQTLQKKYVGEAAGSTTEAASHQAPRSAATGKATSGWIYKCLRPLPPLGKNTFMLSLLGGGALGSFVFSTSAGKNAVHMLHPIFNLGRDENAGKSPYQIAMSKAPKQDEIDVTNTADNDFDATHRRARTLRRKASMKRRIETGHSLSDTHGNTWPHNAPSEEMQKDKSMHRAEAWGRRQTNRRKTVRDRIERGKALSDSTGGHWSNENDGNAGEKL